MPIKQPFKVDSVLYNYNDLKVLNRVVDLFRDVNTASKLGAVLLLEDFGSTLEQGAYTDTTGHYVSYRISPSFTTHLRALAAVEQLELKLKQLLHQHPTRNVTSEKKEDVTTLYYISGVNSIGD